ncbi:hypothetical protein WJX72_003212 [[Myrmecia] bisecta]|uniref:PUA domain-containing protein n=1 Tax=[Myrmecia] bisecta TaxID=41462 RepID=A0AAW1QEL4_9CHLO
MTAKASTSLIVVIKVGTSSLVRAEQNSLNLGNLARICETVRDLHAAGHRVVLVSSGAVGVGCQRLGLTTRPTGLAQKQALAAVGQVHLMRYYDYFLAALNLHCAQVLLTLDNLANRTQYLNARNTFLELFNQGSIIPIVNENDTVAVDQLRFGDNDTLSAQVATLVQADWLFLLTDVDSLYTANPSSDPNAQPIHEVPDISQLQVDTGSAGSQWGTGGMATKLTAARIATAAGCRMVICSASHPENIVSILGGKRVGTVFWPHPNSLRGRKRWILSVPVKGQLWMDDGAVRAVKERKKSLFSAGIVHVGGDFSSQDAVQLCTAQGVEFGRGLCNYSYEEVDKMKGKSSKDTAEQLGYLGPDEVVNRDNICLLAIPGGQDLDSSGYDVADRLAVLQQRNSSRNHTDATASSSKQTGAGMTVEERLQLLRNRDSLDSAGALPGDWRHEVLTAIDAERTMAVAAQQANGTAVQLTEDVTDEGWLPS